MKVFVTGASGQLGYDVCRELERRSWEYSGVSSIELDITNQQAVSDMLHHDRPDVVIHCAAYTAVDKAEEEPEQCWSANVDGTRNVAVVCKEIGAKLIYISTDYVFPGIGDSFYETDDPVGPKNVYGRSKLAGELIVQSLLKQYFIVRISWVFGKNGNNFVKTMLRLAESRGEVRVVCDQVGSPTYTADLAPLLCDMAVSEKYGVYHATNEGICSWAEFAQEIFRTAGKSTEVHAIPSAAYPTKAIRPLNSRMEKCGLIQNGFKRLPHWQTALERYIREE